MDNFSLRLKIERERLGLDQDQMAAAGGVKKRAYCYYESGERQPDADFLGLVADAGADVQYLLTGKRGKQITRPISETFHRASSDGVDAVLDRMFEAVGKPLAWGYAKALDISDDTLKKWLKRGEVPMGYLEGFAREYGKPLDWLLHGTPPEGHAEPHQVNQDVAPYGLKPDEATLLGNYRRSPPEAQAALLATSAVFAQPAEGKPTRKGRDDAA